MATNNPHNVALNSMINKENQYRKFVTDNHTMTNDLSMVVKAMEVDLKDCLDDESKNELAEFTKTCQEKLIQLAHKNVEQNREVDAFVDALRAVRNLEEVDDFERRIEAEMNRVKMTKEYPDIEQEELVREVRGQLGLAVAAGEGGDSDIEYVDGETTENFNCPITMKLMEEPFKTKCGHTFSKEGLLALCNKGQSRCPIPGCNKVIRVGEWTPDRQMEFKVKRHKRRKGLEREQQMSQAIDMAEDTM